MLPNPENTPALAADEAVINELVHIDRENAFLLYATFCGDIVRTAHALGIQPASVLAMVDEEKWNDRLKTILELKKSGKPGDLERAINRALNFVQAHKMRLFLERIISRLSLMNQEEMETYMFPEETLVGLKAEERATRKPQRRLSTRPLADLASALEKVHQLAYQALNDTTSERVKRKEETGSDSASDLHAKIAAAMGKVGEGASIRAKLFDAQVEHAQSLAADGVETKRKLALRTIDET